MITIGPASIGNGFPMNVPRVAIAGACTGGSATAGCEIPI